MSVADSKSGSGHNIDMRRNNIHILRRIWHCVGSLIILYVHSMIDNTSGSIMLLIALSTIALLDFIRIQHGNSFPMSALLRVEEQGKISGSLWFMLGVSAAYFLFNPEIFVLVVLYLGIADPVAAIVGIKLGNGDRKTVQGTAASIIACTIITMFYGEYPLTSILYGVIGGTSELLDITGIDDNFCIPVFSGMMLTLINS